MDKDTKQENDDMLPEYDFTGGERGKHSKAHRAGHKVEIEKEDGEVEVHYFKPENGTVMLDSDVQAYFPDSESVNKALRTLIELIPEKRRSA